MLASKRVELMADPFNPFQNAFESKTYLPADENQMGEHMDQDNRTYARVDNDNQSSSIPEAGAMDNEEMLSGHLYSIIKKLFDIKGIGYNEGEIKESVGEFIKIGQVLGLSENDEFYGFMIVCEAYRLLNKNSLRLYGKYIADDLYKLDGLIASMHDKIGGFEQSLFYHFKNASQSISKCLIDEYKSKINCITDDSIHRIEYACQQIKDTERTNELALSNFDFVKNRICKKVDKLEDKLLDDLIEKNNKLISLVNRSIKKIIGLASITTLLCVIFAGCLFYWAGSTSHEVTSSFGHTNEISEGAE